MDIFDLTNCRLCPNDCGINRHLYVGKCGMKDEIVAARAALHFFEEPCISGKNGSGTIFFSGCSMECVYCQNYCISRDKQGKEISSKWLSQIFKELEDQGAHNINLVSATHFMPMIIRALDIYKPNIPIVYNTSGYEKAELVHALGDYIDIYLTDFKYFDFDISFKLSKRGNYFSECDKAIRAMINTKGRPVYDKNGMLKSGVIIRHLVLPSYIDNSIKVLKHIALNYKNDVITSIMSQYTPVLSLANHQELNRPLKPLEYKIVLNMAKELQIENGYMQELASGTSDFIPEFNEFGI